MLHSSTPLHFKSPSSSSSSSSSALDNPKTMEEIWKDITINSLPNTPIPHQNPNSNSNFRGIILQDFLRDPQNRGSDSSINARPPPVPATVLTLNSGPGFNFLDTNTHSGQLKNNPLPNFSAYDGLSSSSVFNSFGGKNCVPEIEEVGNNGNQRHKRMIKNRESAARSRARKQAYITELQHEVCQLQEENDKLRKQLHQVYAAPATHYSKNHGPRQASTSPF